MMVDHRWMDDDIIAKLRQDFSYLSTMNRAREELRSLVQALDQPISLYVYNYAQMHYLASGVRAHQENHPFMTQEFITSLDTNLKRMVAKKYTDVRSRPQTLQAAFTLVEEMAGKMQEAELFKHTTSFRLPTSVNEICGSGGAEINEVSQGCWNNNYQGGKSGGYKGSKPWQNEGKKPWQKQ